jgi:hypothetical protein
MKAHLIPVALAVLAMASARVAAQPVSTQPVPALDHSSPASALIARGVPSPDRVWTPEDYEGAVKTLEALAKADPLTLPRAGSPQSGPVFARLVAEDNLEPIRKEADTQQAFGMVVRLTLVTNSLLNLYGSPSTLQSTFDSEIAAIMAFSLAVSKELLSMGTRILDTIPANDPQREVRLAGYEKMRGGLGSTIEGGLLTLTESDLFRLEARLQLANALERHLPALYPYLLPGVQQKLPILLQAIAAREPDEALKQAVQRIRATLAKGSS